MLLGRAGRRVLLVDRAPYGSDTLSTHALLDAGVLQLHRWGMLDAVRASGAPPIGRARFHYGGDVVDAAVRPRHGIHALYAPRRTVLDRILVDGAREAGVDTVHGVHVADVHRDRHGRVTGIRGRDAEGQDLSAHADVVIGADGLHSTVARLVGAPVERAARAASAFVYGYFPEVALPGLGADAYDWYFRPGVSAGSIPTNAGAANVFVGLPPARFTTMARRVGIEVLFRTVLREAAPELADALAGVAPVGRHRGFAGRPGYVRRASGPGWALVGDAGSLEDPLGAHGITHALRDAELLARALLDTGDGTAYQVARDALALPFVDLAAATAAYDWSLADLAARHVEMKAVMDAEVALLAGLDTAAPRAA
jgi:2-polyprenyl-6-methoxyphenol hydroxylase-like FAD-dependent oxidoreductase